MPAAGDTALGWSRLCTTLDAVLPAGASGSMAAPGDTPAVAHRLPLGEGGIGTIL